jgi:hypothetical protein
MSFFPLSQNSSAVATHPQSLDLLPDHLVGGAIKIMRQIHRFPCCVGVKPGTHEFRCAMALWQADAIRLKHVAGNLFAAMNRRPS